MEKFTINIVIMFIIWILLFGYGRCIVKFTQCDFESPYKAEAIYGIGLVTGLGGFIGYVNIED